MPFARPIIIFWNQKIAKEKKDDQNEKIQSTAREKPKQKEKQKKGGN